MDDIQEQQELANEISEAISNPIGFNQDIDEDDLLAELEGMEQEEMDSQVRVFLEETDSQVRVFLEEMDSQVRVIG